MFGTGPFPSRLMVSGPFTMLAVAPFVGTQPFRSAYSPDEGRVEREAKVSDLRQRWRGQSVPGRMFRDAIRSTDS